VNYPIVTESVRDGDKQYWCVLTRFDAFSVTFGTRRFYVHANRVTGETQPGDYQHISSTVSQQLGVTKASEV
jgi:hypothetical protein